MTKYPRIQKVFLSGRINSTWQDKVIQSVPELVYFDPRTHNLNNPDQYASWDMHYVKEADILFGYMEKDNPSGYGLATEIGYARGLGKTIILTVDTPYADAVHRLTLPLSKYIIMAEAIQRENLQKYNVDAEIIGFKGVDEVAWVRNFKPHMKYDFGKPLIVVRQLEEKAVYAKNAVDMIALAKKLTRLGTVVFLSRYNRRPVKGLLVPKSFIDSASLVAQGDLFVGAGGTIAREAALQGTPAITVNIFQNQQMNDFLAEKGFPIFKAELAAVPKLAEKLINAKTNVEHLLAKLENPVDVIADAVKRIGESN